MNKLFTIFTALLCITGSPFCNGMNNTPLSTNAKILKEITIIKKPYSVTCFPNNKIVIAGTNQKGHYVSSIYDFFNDTEIPITNYKSDEGLRTESVAAHPNKKIFAVHSLPTLALYDIDNGNKLYEKPLNNYYIGTPVFNPANNTILIGNNRGLDEWDYENNVCTTHPFEDMSTYRKIIMHPTKPSGIILEISQDHILSTFEYDTNNTFVTTGITLPSAITYANTAQYSGDGSLIAFCHDPYKCSILNLKSKETYPFINNNITQGTFSGMASSPISFTVATLYVNEKLQRSYILYGNAKKSTLLTTTPLPISLKNYIGEFISLSAFFDRLNFFSDGTKLVIALHDKCLVVEVPFEAQYQPETKEKCAFALWLFKNYKDENGNNILPQEIAHLVIYNLLQTCKYSFTNY